MKFFALLLFIVACAVSMTSAFAPRSTVATTTAFARPALTRTYINIGEQERDKLTRDSEPEDFFKT
jgi:hypothetical protein